MNPIHVLIAAALVAVPVAPSSAPAVPTQAGCVNVTSEARYRNYGHDHVVRLESACAEVQACQVSTDVNPTVRRVTVAPDAAIEVLTFRGSPAREFRATVNCAPAPKARERAP